MLRSGPSSIPGADAELPDFAGTRCVGPVIPSVSDVPLSGIYGIVDAAQTAEPLRLLEALLAADIRVVQYRDKSGIRRDLLRQMLERTRSVRAALIVNDDFEAALEADGWHAGQEDLAGRNLPSLRAKLGRRLFGVSCGVPDEAAAAAAAGADYVGVGPFAATPSKNDAGDAIGVAGIASVVRTTRLPVVAIGGIGLTNLAEVAASGAAMAAIISAISGSPEAEGTARALVARWSALHP